MTHNPAFTKKPENNKNQKLNLNKLIFKANTTSLPYQIRHPAGDAPRPIAQSKGPLNNGIVIEFKWARARR